MRRKRNGKRESTNKKRKAWKSKISVNKKTQQSEDELKLTLLLVHYYIKNMYYFGAACRQLVSSEDELRKSV